MGQTQLKSQRTETNNYLQLTYKNTDLQKKTQFHNKNTLQYLYSICNIYCLVFEHLHTTDLG